MTHSPQAFLEFKAGLNAWRQYDQRKSRMQDYPASTTAIRGLRSAVRMDKLVPPPGHYQLGLALLKDSQPAAAMSAFRASLRVDPDFAPARTALASLLYSFEQHQSPAFVVGPPPEPRLPPLREAHLIEARELWWRLLGAARGDLPDTDRAAAHYGLCRLALDRATAAFGAANGEDARASYFHCARAGALYASLPSKDRARIEVREAEAGAWTTLGLLLERAGRVTPRLLPDGWHCGEPGGDPRSVRTATFVPGSEFSFRFRYGPYTRRASGYLRRAVDLVPEDIASQCRLAANALALGDRGPMKRLSGFAAPHVRVARGFIETARELHARVEDPKRLAPARGDFREAAAARLRWAVLGFEQAIGRDPSSLDALLGHAATFWESRVKFPEEGRWVAPDARAAESRGGKCAPGRRARGRPRSAARAPQCARSTRPGAGHAWPRDRGDRGTREIRRRRPRPPGFR